MSGLCKYAELEALLYEGALIFFENGEPGSGVDMTKSYLEVLHKSDLVANEDLFRKVAK